MPDDTRVQWVRTETEVQELARLLRREPAIGLDAESDSMWHFREKVCLLQVATAAGDVYLVDTVAVRDLSPLAEVVADASVEKVLHGADYDVSVLRRDFSFDFANLTDTMLAARFLGVRSFGLAALVERELGVSLRKAARTADWSKRPLRPELVRYAAEDVRYLLALRARLTGRLCAVGRERWLREECEELARLPAAPRHPAPADWRHAPGARCLDPLSRSVLRELFATREQVALRLDRPRFKVAPDDVLVRIAALRPVEPGVLLSIRGIPPLVARCPDEWLCAVRRGLEAGPAPNPPPPPPPPMPDPALSGRVSRLLAMRARMAARLGLDPGLLLPRRLVVAVALAAPRDLESLAAVQGFRRWRVEALGAEALRAVR